MKDPPDDVSDGEVLSRILKDIRRLRGQTAQETAARMNMSLRTYERFEAGGTRLNQDYLHRFARATDSDANGILLAIVVRAPDFAIDGADNQLATVLTSGMSRFVRTQGSAIALARGTCSRSPARCSAPSPARSRRPAWPDPSSPRVRPTSPPRAPVPAADAGRRRI